MKPREIEKTGHFVWNMVPDPKGDFVRFDAWPTADKEDSAPIDVYAAYKTWPDDIRRKLSMHDLRRMSGWIAPDDKREICGRRGKPRSELCGDDFIPMPSATPVKDDADAREVEYLRWKLGLVLPVFQEARDALTAILTTQLRLYNISPTLAERMDYAGVSGKEEWHRAIAAEKKEGK